MWTFNGHFWALKRSKNTRFVRNTPERIKKYIASMERRVIRASPITACVLSGSLTQGSFHEYSDIDVWFTKKRGFFNGLWAYFLGVRERSLAFLHRIPIELYFYDPENYIGKDSTEILILVKDTGERWKMVEPGSILLKDYPLNEMDFFK
jgi:predicted nucleotidyltransferase